MLAVGSEGIGTLLKNGTEGLKALRAILEGNKITKAVLESAQDGIRLLKALGGKLKSETRKMWEELIDALDELIGLQAEMVTPDGMRIKVPREKLPQDHILKMEGKGKGGGKTKPKLNEAPKKEVIKVENMQDFFDNTIFGKSLKNSSQKVSRQSQGVFYKIINKVETPHLKKGDYFYLDKLHYDHIEVFDSAGKAKIVLNLDGTINEAKTIRALKEGRTINIR